VVAIILQFTVSVILLLHTKTNTKSNHLFKL